MKPKQKTLEPRYSRLLKRLGRVRPWMEGSVVQIRRICGSAGCACRRGGPKHPAMYVTWKEKKKTVSLYVPRSREKEVLRWANEYKRLKEIIREGTGLARELLKWRQ